MQKKIPFDKKFIEQIIQKYPTPFHLYDESAIRANARKLNQLFSWNKGFKEYFAIKANPNPHLLKIFKEEGCSLDASSMSELKLAEMVGITGEDIMFTSNNTPLAEYEKATSLGAIINFDDLTHLDFYKKRFGKFPALGCFRYNPGHLKGGNEIIGKPKDAKYGLTREQLFTGYEILKNSGVKRFGLHTMVASNELNTNYFLETLEILFDLTKEIEEKLKTKFEFVNIGGGIGIPYQPNDQPVDVQQISAWLKNKCKNQPDLKIFMELGRWMMGPFGWLITKAIHKKHTYKEFIGVDACMTDLMRPALYDAYHHITVLSKGNAELSETYDVVGSLCENNDKFAIDRKLPKIDMGDILVIHDTGAHGHAMGFNYNGKLRSAELLLKPNGSVKQIRRAETFEDYVRTVKNI